MRLVARRLRISESLLYNWRSARKAAAVALGATDTVEFIPIGLIEGRGVPVTPDPEPIQQPAAALARTSGSIEIALPNGVRVWQLGAQIFWHQAILQPEG